MTGSNQTSSASKLARAHKGLQDRLADLEASARDADENVPVYRESNFRLRAEPVQFYIRTYEWSDVQAEYDGDDWGSEDAGWQLTVMDQAEYVDMIGGSDVTVSNDIVPWLASVLDPTGDDDPARTFDLGTGTPVIAPDGTIGNAITPTGTIPRGSIWNGNPHLRGLLTFGHGHEGDEITELRVTTGNGYDILYADLDYPVDISDMAVTLTLRFELTDRYEQLQDDREDFDNDTVGRVFDNQLDVISERLIPQMDTLDAPINAYIGTGFPDLASDTTLDQIDTDIPLTDWYASGGELFITGFVDASRSVGNELTEWGIGSELGSELFSLAPIDPPVNKTALETVQLAAAIEFEYETVEIIEGDP